MILPRLTRFYGGTLDDWLNMPMIWLEQYTDMMPALQAEESLSAVSEMVASDPNYEQDNRQEIIHAWRASVASVQPPPTIDESNRALMALAGML